MVEILKDLYGHLFNPKEQVTHDLIWKYRDKVSSRLLALDQQLKIKGKEASAKMWRDMVYRPNPFLKAISKEPDGFRGK